jgi:hypothetical protein
MVYQLAFRNNQPIFGVEDYQCDWVSPQLGVKDYTNDDNDKPDSKPDDARTKEKLVISGGIIKGIKFIDGEPALLSRKHELNE